MQTCAWSRLHGHFIVCTSYYLIVTDYRTPHQTPLENGAPRKATTLLLQLQRTSLRPEMWTEPSGRNSIVKARPSITSLRDQKRISISVENLYPRMLAYKYELSGQWDSIIIHVPLNLRIIPEGAVDDPTTWNLVQVCWRSGLGYLLCISILEIWQPSLEIYIICTSLY